MNDMSGCTSLVESFPDYCGIGARPLQPGLVNRLVFEFCGDTAGRARIVHAGIAQVGALKEGKADVAFEKGTLDAKTPLLSSVVVTSGGDIQSSGQAGQLDAVSQGLWQRSANWASGGPSWLIDADNEPVRVMFEIDLRHGQMALHLGDWSEKATIVKLPGLRDKSADVEQTHRPRASRLDSSHMMGTRQESQDVVDKPWLPFVSLTAEGQQVRILDFHVCSDL